MAKRRLKKRMKTGVRRTIAALLMVTALVVAAIPGTGTLADSDAEDLEEEYLEEEYFEEEYYDDAEYFEEEYYDDDDDYDDSEEGNDKIWYETSQYICDGLKYTISGTEDNATLTDVAIAEASDYG